MLIQFFKSTYMTSESLQASDVILMWRWQLASWGKDGESQFISEIPGGQSQKNQKNQELQTFMSFFLKLLIFLFFFGGEQLTSWGEQTGGLFSSNQHKPMGGSKPFETWWDPKISPQDLRDQWLPKNSWCWKKISEKNNQLIGIYLSHDLFTVGFISWRQDFFNPNPKNHMPPPCHVSQWCPNSFCLRPVHEVLELFKFQFLKPVCLE